MNSAHRVVEEVLSAATVDETIVLVTERAEAALRWAGNSMTTAGESTSRKTAVISIVRQGSSSRGSVRCRPARWTRG